ncbi:helix-turn-helix domain-containing protein [Sinomicrobium weinanense]|uniref:Helix-turn-helix domain-containing protein n=1 Tax=Sinomicrobium weinanense TaxID=2842200 RepID=A0A926JPF2_9FLAO|nr:helix-turn-helix domain-containing protein [Sinomicrobium weinanense]MBC9794894.1 helix-turn-helix domain-containing protein [Sinomicrobium weinanense]MBU3125665.1 helix-turn-helix domain-containing protein [Sinomicrobium weinanense]
MEDSGLQKRVKDLRIKKGLSQEELADKTGLSLRTIQRIEHGESVPRGDTLKRLSIALQATPDDLIDWQVQEDKNVVKILSLSQLGFLAFPLLGIIIPLAIWILKKDKTKYVDSVGKSILNFQITWTIVLFALYVFFIANMIFHLQIIPLSMLSVLLIIGGLYLYNLIMIIRNTILVNKIKSVKYIPAIRFLS